MNHKTNTLNSGTATKVPGGLFSAPRQDFLASIVVFLVALPLCMGIAIASGVPVAAGLITGIVGGLVVGWIAGAPMQVSGPAAGLTVIVFELVRQHGLEVHALPGLGSAPAEQTKRLPGELGLGEEHRNGSDDEDEDGQGNKGNVGEALVEDQWS